MFTRIVGLVGVVAFGAVVGCSGDDGGGGQGGNAPLGTASGNGTGSGNGSGNGSGSGSNTTTTGTGSSFSCCLNQEHFTCPSESAVNNCFDNFDPSGCAPSAGDCGGSTSGDPTTGGNGSTGSGGDDVGSQCTDNSDCMFDACLFAPGTDFGYCSKICSDFTDCPTFWSCEEVENASGTYCVQD